MAKKAARKTAAAPEPGEKYTQKVLKAQAKAKEARMALLDEAAAWCIDKDKTHESTKQKKDESREPLNLRAARYTHNNPKRQTIPSMRRHEQITSSTRCNTSSIHISNKHSTAHALLYHVLYADRWMITAPKRADMSERC